MFYDREWAIPTNKYISTSPTLDLWENITMISDVNSLYIFEIGEKKFYFFGDQHYSKSEGNCEQQLGVKCDDYDDKYKDGIFYGNKCTSIGLLLKNWFIYNKDHKIQTDFFLELGFTKENERTELRKINNTIDRLRYTEEKEGDQLKNESWLFLVATLMEPCFVREKRSCPYHPYIHAHYADVRKYNSSNEEFHSDPFVLYDVLEYVQRNMPNKKNGLLELRDELSIILSIIVQDYKKIIDGIIHSDGFEKFLEEFHNMSNSFSQTFGKLFIKKFENMRKISVVRDKKIMHRTAGELLRLRKENNYIANLIEEFIYNKIEEYVDKVKYQFEDLLLILDDFENMSVEEMQYEFIRIMNEFIGDIIPMSTLSMDAYLLARMFLQSESKEIIVYAGSEHIRNYSEFFQSYLGVDSKIAIPSIFDNRCLQSKDLPKYLDANKYRLYVTNKKYGIK